MSQFFTNSTTSPSNPANDKAGTHRYLLDLYFKKPPAKNPSPSKVVFFPTVRQLLLSGGSFTCSVRTYFYAIWIHWFHPSPLEKQRTSLLHPPCSSLKEIRRLPPYSLSSLPFSMLNMQNPQSWLIRPGFEILPTSWLSSSGCVLAWQRSGVPRTTLHTHTWQPYYGYSQDNCVLGSVTERRTVYS